VRQAIVIGCSQYRQLPPLRYAVADAKEVGAAFEALGYQVAYAIDPTLADLRAYLRRAVEQTSSELGSLTVFFAGNGYADQDDRYLALTDTDPRRNLRATALPYGELISMLQRSKARQKILLFDSAFSGSDGAATSNPTWDPGLPEFEVITSNGPFQQPVSPALGHGIFSYFLIQGLKGEAAGPDGVIAIDGLERYVRNQVNGYTNGLQIPYSWSTMISSFPVGVVRK
jgi:uncharacterized caspase-like protein